MQSSEAQQLILKNLGVRIEPHMSEYAAAQLSERKPFPVMGGDARTGVPVSLIVDPAQLNLKLINPSST